MHLKYDVHAEINTVQARGATSLAAVMTSMVDMCPENAKKLLSRVLFSCSSISELATYFN